MSTVVLFQFNPERITRSVRARAPGYNVESVRLTGAPIETLSMAVEIDATDQPATDQPRGGPGIHPQLARLELLLYPPSSDVQKNANLEANDTLPIVHPEAPLTLLVWGPRRVLPVRLTEFSIVEQFFSASLDPIRAQINLSMRVLSYSDLPPTNKGHHIFLAHQIAKESMTSVSGGRDAPADAVVGVSLRSVVQ
ncbi:hypothetical protein [Cryptosporangium sp. NPDC051539]|uniref:hypothetical protein n=1 Tax=Cryptosporangium sp. NPDC051539 TaxID=3363962 RepID=UPI0037B7F349